MGDGFVQSVIESASLANYVLPCNDVPLVLTIESPAAPSAIEVAEFSVKVLKALERNTQITDRLVGLYAEIDSMEDFAQEELKGEEERFFPSSRRGLLSNFHLKTTSHDTFDTPTVFPTTPISTTPLPTTPPYNPTPTIVTVPATNPWKFPPPLPSPEILNEHWLLHLPNIIIIILNPNNSKSSINNSNTHINNSTTNINNSTTSNNIISTTWGRCIRFIRLRYSTFGFDLEQPGFRIHARVWE